MMCKVMEMRRWISIWMTRLVVEMSVKSVVYVIWTVIYAILHKKQRNCGMMNP